MTGLFSLLVDDNPGFSVFMDMQLKEGGGGGGEYNASIMTLKKLLVTSKLQILCITRITPRDLDDFFTLENMKMQLNKNYISRVSIFYDPKILPTSLLLLFGESPIRIE